MDMTKLNPWNWFKKEDEQAPLLPIRRDEDDKRGASGSLASLHSEIDRLFDQAFRGFGFDSPLSRPSALTRLAGTAFKPSIDVAGSEKEYTITAELPGMDEKDISIELKGDSLIIKGEKRQEESSEDKGFYRVERSYGAFQRILHVPTDADTDNITARSDNGVITITLPRKDAPDTETKQITIE